MTNSWPYPDFDAPDAFDGVDDPGPDVKELERDMVVGRRCCECGSKFRRAQPASIPYRAQTLCHPCARLKLEEFGYNMGPERTANNEAWADKNRSKK